MSIHLNPEYSDFGRPFVKRFAICYRTVVLSCLLARLQTWRAIIFSRVCLWVCLCVFVKSLLDSNKTDGGDTFWSLPFRQPPADCSVQRSGRWQQRCTDPEMLRPHHSADSDHRSANWGHSDLGAPSGPENQLACRSVCLSVCLRRWFIVAKRLDRSRWKLARR